MIYPLYIASHPTIMQKQYRQAYLNLARLTALPANCMPLSSKRKQADSLTKLLSINKTIMEMIDPDVTSLVHRKRNSHAHFINLEKSTETSKGAPPRIHPNGGLLAATVTAKSRHKINSLQHQSVYDIQKEDNSTGLRRKDLYDEHINKFMTTKYEREEIIQNYLSNRDTFVKQACEEIEKDIRKDTEYMQKSTDRLKGRSPSKKLPRIEEFSNLQLKKSKSKPRHGEYIQSITHLRKAETLQLKDRQRKQRVFRRKINSLECRLDQIRYQKYP